MRWVIVGFLLAVTGMVMYTALSACVLSSPSEDTVPLHDRGRDANWEPPQQLFLTSPMRDQPVPGWRVSSEDLGLPAADSPSGQPRIADSTEPYGSYPLIGNLEDNAYFLARTDAAHPDWWLVGLDIRTGHRLFLPVPLGSGRPPECFLNGPHALLCLSHEAADTAWVIDSHNGHIVYHGETDLAASGNRFRVEQVGTYAVAAKTDQGVYGIGTRAETTWFVPGDGKVGQGVIGTPDFAPLNLATQTVAGRGPDRMLVFSVVDGTVIKPKLDSETRTQTAAVFPGGFALEMIAPGSLTVDAIGFFDYEGNEIGRTPSRGSLDALTRNLPTVTSSSGAAMYSAEGYLLAEIAEYHSGYGALMIGDRLYVDRPRADDRYQEYNLRTGEKVKTCGRDMTGYIGSDGEVGVFSVGNPNTGLSTRGVDLASCTVSWDISSAPGSWRHVWRINTTLVQLSDDGTELMSLVAPHE